ncbi:MAG: hypothetical protein ACLFUB_20685 [Cyclobacteriaceae bacterium]
MDRGFIHQADEALLGLFIPEVIMPKKGSLQEKERGNHPKFRKLKDRHSAIESDIKELEQRGLNRCPDHRWKGV